MFPDSVLFACVQRDSVGLTSENNELKFRLQALEQQAQLKDGIMPFSSVLYMSVGNHSYHIFHSI